MKDSIRNDMTLSFDAQRVHARASETYSCSCDAQLRTTITHYRYLHYEH